MGRQRWYRSAREELAALGDTPPPTFRTAPLPAGTVLELFEDCDCDYTPPGPPASDPAWTDWTEDPPRTSTKLSLRLELTRAPTNGHPGGLIGPNFYRTVGLFHSGDARREQPGFPDLLLFTPLPVANEAWELKAMGKNPTLPQAHHMTLLKLSGYRVRTVRPCCLLSGSVDRWLGALAGVAPTLSTWAPDLDDTARAAGRQRTARAMLAGAGRPTSPAAPATAAPARPAVRRPAALEAPGQPVDPHEPGGATGHIIPMPVNGGAPQAQLEAWLREHGFPPNAVPWPMRVVIGERVLVVWANTGEPGTPGRPRPRDWRSAALIRPFPDAAAAALAGTSRPATSMPAAMSQTAPAVQPEEPR
jgi:hypothetical protein